MEKEEESTVQGTILGAILAVRDDAEATLTFKDLDNHTG